jgi:hypothetical protein
MSFRSAGGGKKKEDLAGECFSDVGFSSLPSRAVGECSEFPSDVASPSLLDHVHLRPKGVKTVNEEEGKIQTVKCFSRTPHTCPCFLIAEIGYSSIGNLALPMGWKVRLPQEADWAIASFEETKHISLWVQNIVVLDQCKKFIRKGMKLLIVLVF